ncbi:MAG: site-2 protease family protein [Novosphingobium sp.]
MNDTVLQAAALILPLIFAIVFHEVAHGMMARHFGDHTAERQGRLSLNPFKHVDPIGTVVLPGILALAHMPVFGWAKPVPVDSRQLRHPRRDMMLVGAAGPGSNLIMAAIAGIALGWLMAPYAGRQLPTGVPGFLALMLAQFVSINVFLALFNLLPIPPFDGSHIVEGLLPEPLARGYAKFRSVGMLIPIFLLIVLPSILPGFDALRYIYRPVSMTITTLCPECAPILQAN